MLTKPIVTVFLMGCALIALGLIPGPLARIREGIQNFRGEFSQFPIFPRQPRRASDDDRLPGQIWVAVGGMALVLISMLAFLTN